MNRQLGPYLRSRNRRMTTAFSRNAQGFTFLEIMLVVVIIGILAAIVGPRLVGKSQAAKIQAATMQLQNIKTALSEFEMVAGRFPSGDEGLDALIDKPSGMDAASWSGPYMDEVPMDPWNKPYKYVFPGEKHRDYDLWSVGPDGQDGTDDDIANWKKASKSGGGA